MLPNAKLPPCDLRVPKSSQSPTLVKYTILFTASALMSTGAGGIRLCSLAFGADQIDCKDNPKRERVGFGIPVVLMLISTLSFIVAYPLYYKMKVEKSLFTSLCQVVSVAWKNRIVTLPDSSDGSWHYRNDTKLVSLQNPKIQTKIYGACALVEQVGELKALIRVIPLWSSSIMLSVNVNQSAFPVLQAKTMDRHVTKNFEIPPASLGFFNIVTLMVWVMLYDRVIIPLLSKSKGKPVYISVKLRMGAGLVFSILAMVTLGIIEHIRKQKAIEEGFFNDSQMVVKMSVMWLVPQQVFHGLSEALNIIVQMEFYYSEFPKSMLSVATSLYLLGAGIRKRVGFRLSSVNAITKEDGKESWVSTKQCQRYYQRRWEREWAYCPCAERTVVKGQNANIAGEEDTPRI
nr:protein NRT1/ PTR FAMILY 1.2-like [Tanacetum cinerariifolium]